MLSAFNDVVLFGDEQQPTFIQSQVRMLCLCKYCFWIESLLCLVNVIVWSRLDEREDEETTNSDVVIKKFIIIEAPSNVQLMGYSELSNAGLALEYREEPQKCLKANVHKSKRVI